MFGLRIKHPSSLAQFPKNPDIKQILVNSGMSLIPYFEDFVF